MKIIRQESQKLCHRDCVVAMSPKDIVPLSHHQMCHVVAFCDLRYNILAVKAK